MPSPPLVAASSRSHVPVRRIRDDPFPLSLEPSTASICQYPDRSEPVPRDTRCPIHRNAIDGRCPNPRRRGTHIGEEESLAPVRESVPSREGTPRPQRSILRRRVTGTGHEHGGRTARGNSVRCLIMRKQKAIPRGTLLLKEHCEGHPRVQARPVGNSPRFLDLRKHQMLVPRSCSGRSFENKDTLISNRARRTALPHSPIEQARTRIQRLHADLR